MLLEKTRIISMWFSSLLSTIACVCLFAITMTFIDQMLDLQMIITQNIETIMTERSLTSVPASELYSFASAAVFVTFLAWMVYITSTKLIKHRADRISRYNRPLIETPSFLVFSEAAPIFFFCVTLASLPIGMVVAYKEELLITRYLDAAREIYHPLGVIALIYLLFAATIFMVTYFIGRDRIVNSLFSTRGTLAVTIVLTAFILGIAYDAVLVAPIVGTIPLVTLFIAFLGYYSALLRIWSHESGIPCISVLLGCAVAFAYFDLNDNHRIHYRLKHLTRSNYKPNAFEVAFVTWAKSRNDRAYYEGKHAPYPIYIVSAEGGGLYAAYNLAMFLAKIQDACPTFAQHLFTISSVSGGSLGAAVFAGLSKELAENSNWKPCQESRDKPQFQNFVRTYFSRDFLAPLVAAGLFPDFLQRFLPVPIRSFDRSLALENSFYAAWEWSVKRRGAPARYRNPFGQSMDTFWDPMGAFPNLAVNLTSVETGARISVSPLYFVPTPTAVHINDAVVGACDDEYVVPSMNLATAVSLSARFPWVTPVGWLETGQVDKSKCRISRTSYGSRLYLGDGGYFENSGMELVTELAARIRRAAGGEALAFPYGLAVRVIRVGVYDEYVKRFNVTGGEKSDRGYGELLTPIMTLLNARKARALAVMSRYSFDGAYFSLHHPLFQGDDQQKAGDARHPSHELYRFDLDATSAFFPLGWQLSKRSMDRMEETSADQLLVLRSDIEVELTEGGAEQVR